MARALPFDQLRGVSTGPASVTGRMRSSTPNGLAEQAGI